VRNSNKQFQIKCAKRMTWCMYR